MCLSDDQLAQFARRGWVTAAGFFSPAQAAEISAWTDELAARPEEPGAHMVYHETSLEDPGVRLIQRIENFCPYHAGFDRLVQRSPQGRRRGAARRAGGRVQGQDQLQNAGRRRL